MQTPRSDDLDQQPDPVVASVSEVGARLRAPWAASAAGILFAILFTASLVLIRGGQTTDASDEELVRLFVGGGDTLALIGALYLGPFAGIMFLWFIAVIRDQLGDREDRFFATVFFGSGVLFAALYFAALAVASSISVGARYLEQPPPTAATVGLVRSLAYTLMFAFATRAAAVFLIALASVGLRSRVFPRWVAFTGYAVGLVLLLVVSFWDWVILLLPAWVAVVSIYILRRERGRVRSSGASAPVA